MVDEARAANRSGFTLPDHMWFAWTNKVANNDGGPYLSAAGWKSHQRIHQYYNGVNVTYGGYTVNIDHNVLDVGTGSAPTAQQAPCGVPLRLLVLSQAQARLGPVQQYLRCSASWRWAGTPRQGSPATFDNGDTQRHWKKVRKDHRLEEEELDHAPAVERMLADGSKPRVLKLGSVGEPVWRLQRALVAAGYKVTINGVYDGQTSTAVAKFRKKHKAGNVRDHRRTDWNLLQRGKTA